MEIVKKLVEIPQEEVAEISKAVAIAKELEIKARDFYQKNADKSDEQDVKNAFMFLVKEEQEHFDALTAVEDTLKKEGKFAVVSDEVLKHLEKPQVYPDNTDPKKDIDKKNELTVLLWAMRMERKAELFYREQAGKTSVPEVKEFFNTLAEFEVGHFQYLDGIFSSWTSTDDFILG